jgi:acyl carrier protein
MSLDTRLTKVFKTVFDIDIIDNLTSITTLSAWDSLAHMTLLLELEDEFGVEMLVEEAAEWTSVGTIKDALIQRGVEC